MVLRPVTARAGAMKRGSPSVSCDGYPNWDAPPAPAHIPYAHYALIYLDSQNSIRVEESLSIREQNAHVISQDVVERFLRITQTRAGRPRPNNSKPFPIRARPLDSDISHAHARGWCSVRDFREDDCSMARATQRRKLMPHETPEMTIPGSQASFANGSIPTQSLPDLVELTISDTERVVHFYETAFRMFQQTNCRHVAKAFIKFIEPRKQVRHPYNGGPPPPGAPPGTKGDPEKTKPEWWPPGVRHREPDHLKKEERLKLLVHILRKLSHIGITADMLKEVASDTRRQLKRPYTIEFLSHVFRVRKLEEAYERGERDGDTKVFVPNLAAMPKNDQSLGNEEDEETSGPGDSPSPVQTQASARIPTSTPALSAASSPPSLAGAEPNTIFQVSDTIGFEAQQNPPYYTAPTDEPHVFPHAVFRAQQSPDILTSGAAGPSFEFLTSAQFPTSADGTQIQVNPHRPAIIPVPQSPAHFDTWMPVFRQDMFSPVNYGIPTNQAVSQQSPIQMQVPLTPTSLPSDATIQPAAVNTGRARADDDLGTSDGRGLAFRTGSLSHPNVS